MAILTYVADRAERWPFVEPAPRSDVGDLARAWLRDGRWDALPALLDALRDAGRDADANAVRAEVARHACDVLGTGGPPDPTAFVLTAGDSWRANAMRILWWDLFGFDSTVAAIANAGRA